jgi:ubiquinone/menaquinone biosynthesis C-methylase UbiE
MAKRYPDVQFHGADTSNYAPTPKQQRHHPKNVIISVVQDLDNLNYDDQTFDFVVCRFQSFRIADWRSLVNEMVRVTKAGW